MNDSDRISLIRSIARIRSFELHLLDLFEEGKLFGTTHTCVGQEVCAVALYAHIDPARDAVFSNHRCHGHFLAFGGSMEGLLAEIMGRSGAVCRGRGGSQHLHAGRFHSNGVQGGGMPIAAGYAWRIKKEGKGGLVVAHIGDGTLGEGVLYETLNMASLLSLPLLVVLEHNGYAQSTDTSLTTAGEILQRFTAFGIEADRRAADDPVELARYLEGVVQRVRQGRPFVQVLDTFRLLAHSKGDDDRPPQLVQEAWERDYFARSMQSGAAGFREAWDEACAEVKALSARVEAAPLLDLEATNPYAASKEHLFESSGELSSMARSEPAPPLRVNEQLNRALDRMLEERPEVILIGEDLADPYGGAFKVTRGLSTKYPERVLSTPLSEAGIIGLANGVALSGGRPVVEIMFGDFVTLALDQLINQAAKMHFMYGGQVSVPLTVRLVSGGYRGYGATHSQSLETRLCGVPGLKVVALSRHHDSDCLLTTSVLRDDNPVVFVENKLLYTARQASRPPTGFELVTRANSVRDHYPSLFFSTSTGEEPDITVVTYGGLTDMVEQAMIEVILEEEVNFDYFVLTQLYPIGAEDIAESAVRSGKLLIVEEGVSSFGIGAEVVSRVHEVLGKSELEVRRVGALEVPIPCSRRQEAQVLPSKQRLVESLNELWGSPAHGAHQHGS